MMNHWSRSPQGFGGHSISSGYYRRSVQVEPKSTCQRCCVCKSNWRMLLYILMGSAVTVIVIIVVLLTVFFIEPVESPSGNGTKVVQFSTSANQIERIVDDNVVRPSATDGAGLPTVKIIVKNNNTKLQDERPEEWTPTQPSAHHIDHSINEPEVEEIAITDQLDQLSELFPLQDDSDYSTAGEAVPIGDSHEIHLENHEPVAESVAVKLATISVELTTASSTTSNDQDTNHKWMSSTNDPISVTLSPVVIDYADGSISASLTEASDVRTEVTTTALLPTLPSELPTRIEQMVPIEDLFSPLSELLDSRFGSGEKPTGQFETFGQSDDGHASSDGHSVGNDTSDVVLDDSPFVPTGQLETLDIPPVSSDSGQVTGQKTTEQPKIPSFDNVALDNTGWNPLPDDTFYTWLTSGLSKLATKTDHLTKTSASAAWPPTTSASWTDKMATGHSTVFTGAEVLLDENGTVSSLPVNRVTLADRILSEFFEMTDPKAHGQTGNTRRPVTVEVDRKPSNPDVSLDTSDVILFRTKQDKENEAEVDSGQDIVRTGSFLGGIPGATGQSGSSSSTPEGVGFGHQLVRVGLPEFAQTTMSSTLVTKEIQKSPIGQFISGFQEVVASSSQEFVKSEESQAQESAKVTTKTGLTTDGGSQFTQSAPEVPEVLDLPEELLTGEEEKYHVAESSTRSFLSVLFDNLSRIPNENRDSDSAIEESKTEGKVADSNGDDFQTKVDYSETMSKDVENFKTKAEDLEIEIEDSVTNVEDSEPNANYMVKDSGTEVKDSETTIEDSDSKVSDSNPKVNNSGPKIGDSETKVDNSDSKVSDSESKVSNSQPKVNGSETIIEDFNPEVSDLKPNVSLSESKVRDSETKVEDSGTNVSNPEVNVKTKDEGSDLDVNNSKPKINNSEAKVEDSAIKVTNSETKVSDSEIKVNDLASNNSMQKPDFKTMKPFEISSTSGELKRATVTTSDSPIMTTAMQLPTSFTSRPKGGADVPELLNLPTTDGSKIESWKHIGIHVTTAAVAPTDSTDLGALTSSTSKKHPHEHGSATESVTEIPTDHGEASFGKTDVSKPGTASQLGHLEMIPLSNVGTAEEVLLTADEEVGHLGTLDHSTHATTLSPAVLTVTVGKLNVGEAASVALKTLGGASKLTSFGDAAGKTEVTSSTIPEVTTSISPSAVQPEGDISRAKINPTMITSGATVATMTSSFPMTKSGHSTTTVFATLKTSTESIVKRPLATAQQTLGVTEVSTSKGHPGLDLDGHTEVRENTRRLI